MKPKRSIKNEGSKFESLCYPAQLSSQQQLPNFELCGKCLRSFQLKCDTGTTLKVWKRVSTIPTAKKNPKDFKSRYLFRNSKLFCPFSHVKREWQYKFRFYYYIHSLDFVDHLSIRHTIGVPSTRRLI